MGKGGKNGGGGGDAGEGGDSNQNNINKNAMGFIENKAAGVGAGMAGIAALSHFDIFNKFSKGFDYLRQHWRTGDGADTLTCRTSVVVLLAIFVVCNYCMGTLNKFMCWLPPEFNTHATWPVFSLDYCIVHLWYWPMADWPPPHDRSGFQEGPRPPLLEYYNWVPYLFAAHAIFLYAPWKLWKALCGLCGIELSVFDKQLRMAWDKSIHPYPQRKDTLRKEAADRFFDHLHAIRSSGHKHVLPLAYVCWKIVNSLNCVIQLYLLNWFFPCSTYSMWGPEIFRDLVVGNTWESTGNFPRFGWCDVPKTESANIQYMRLKCPMLMNIFYEKFAIMLWFWFPFVAIMNIWSAITLLKDLYLSDRSKYFELHMSEMVKGIEDDAHSEASTSSSNYQNYRDKSPASTDSADSQLALLPSDEKKVPLDTIVNMDGVDTMPVIANGKLNGVNNAYAQFAHPNGYPMHHPSAPPRYASFRKNIFEARFPPTLERSHKEKTPAEILSASLGREGWFLVRQASVAIGPVGTNFLVQCLAEELGTKKKTS